MQRPNAMYRTRTAIFFLSLALGSIATAQAEASHFPLEIFDVLDNHRLVTFIRSEDIAASPQWVPSDGAPPLTIGEVIFQVAREIERDPRLRGAKIYEIELKPINGHASENRWYYLLQLRTHRDRKPKAHYLAVLMSGKVVPTIEEPASIK
jgi:hypothetical protein